MREILKNLALCVFSILVFLALAEGASRLIGVSYGPSPMDPQNFKADRAAEHDALLGYRLRQGIEVSGFRYNSLGFAGPEFQGHKPDGTYRIFCLGGSTTLGTGTEADRYSYPAILQEIFDKTMQGGTKRIEIINGGVFGYHSWHTAIRVLRQLDRYSPDMYLVMDGLNDLAAAKNHTVEQLVEFVKDKGSPLSALMADQSHLARINNLLNRLAFYRLMRKALAPTSPQSHSGYGLDRIEEKFSLFGYKRNLEQAAKSALSKSIRFVIVEYPWKVGMDPSDSDVAMLGMHPEHAALYSQGRRLLRQANKALSSELNLRLIETQGVFDLPPSDRKAIRRVWADDIHWTRYGNYMLAKTVYKELMSLPGFKEMTGRGTPASDQELDAAFVSILGWRPSDGQGWPGSTWKTTPVVVESLENIKEGPRDSGSGFTAWVPAASRLPGKIRFRMAGDSLPRECAIYARISGDGDSVEMSGPGGASFTLANSTGDGLWSPMSGWYTFTILGGGQAEIVLKGENAQIWHKDKSFLFEPPSPAP